MKSKLTGFLSCAVIHTIIMIFIHKGFLFDIKFLSMFFLLLLFEAVTCIILPPFYRHYPKQILSAIFFSTLMSVIFAVIYHFVLKLRLTNISIILIALGFLSLLLSINLFIYNFIIKNCRPRRRTNNKKELY